MPTLVAGSEPNLEERYQRKTLYLHVGPPKTGSTAIQVACIERQEEFKSMGIFCPSPQNKLNHNDEWVAFTQDPEDTGLTEAWLRDLKQHAQSSPVIFISTEIASVNPDLSLLNLLSKHFRVKYIYCKRNITDCIASFITMVMLENGASGRIALCQQSLDFYICEYYDLYFNAHEFFSKSDAQFLSYEELNKDANFLENFFRQALGTKISLPNRYANTSKEHGEQEFSEDKLRMFERFLKLREETLVSAYSRPNGKSDFGKLICKTIKDRTKEKLDSRKSEFNLGANDFYCSKGFYSRESTHRWAGKSAMVYIPIPQNSLKPTSITFFNTHGLVTEKHNQNLFIRMCGREVAHFVYQHDNNLQTIVIPIRELATAQLVMEMHCPNAISPQKLGINDDTRLLSIAFEDFKLSYFPNVQ